MAPGAAGALWLHDPDGRPRARLSPRVTLALAGRREQKASPSSWRRDGEGFVADVELGPTRWGLRVDGRGVTATLTRTAAAALASAAVDLFVVAADAVVLDRAYRFVAPPARADRWTPQVARLGRVTLLGDAPGWRVAPTREDGQQGFVVRVELDAAAARPFAPLSTCVAGQPTVQDMWSRVPRVERSAAPWPAATTTTVQVRLLVDAPPLPLLLRWPRGQQAALVFADHADQASAARLAALAWGQATAADLLAARPPKPSSSSPSSSTSKTAASTGRGLVGRGLTLTKSVFALPHWYYPAQLDDPRFVAVLDALADDGVDVGVHSVSGGADTPAVTATTLQGAFARYRPSTWIDHQPITNCEALSSRGAQPGPWRIVDVLQQAGVRYAWSGQDVRLPHLNLFEPARRDGVAPVLYQHPDTGSLWLFPSVWMALPRDRFVARYDDAALDRLQAERGLHVAHTYLDIHVDSGTPLDAWTLLDRVPGGYRLSDEADAVFARLQQRQDRGALWVTTLAQAADHLRAVFGVRLDVDGTDVVLRSEGAVPGLSLAWPDGSVRVVDLPAGETRLPWPGGGAAAAVVVADSP